MTDPSSAGARLRELAGRILPPPVSLPLRSRFGNSREPELVVLPRFVRPGDTVIDVGAHKGVYTYRLARMVGPSGHVIAYEPQPHMIAYLTAAARYGVMRHVDVRTCALSDVGGTATLSVPIEDGVVVEGRATLRDVGADVKAHIVQVNVLDDEPMPGRVSFIKIDVEGQELPLLAGAKQLLARDKPTMLIEVEYRHAGENVGRLADLLLDEFGYTARELGRDGALVPVDRDRWNGESLNHRSGGRYVNNFVFQA